MKKYTKNPGEETGDYLNPKAGRHYRARPDLSDEEKEQILTLAGCLGYKVLVDEFGVKHNSIANLVTEARESGRKIKRYGSRAKFRKAAEIYETTEDEKIRELIKKYRISSLVDKTVECAKGYRFPEERLYERIFAEPAFELQVSENDIAMIETDILKNFKSESLRSASNITTYMEKLPKTMGRNVARRKRLDPSGSERLKVINKQIRKALKNLLPIEKGVLRKRFGVGGKPVPTLKELEREFGFSREKIRQIEARTLEKLEAGVEV